MTHASHPEPSNHSARRSFQLPPVGWTQLASSWQKPPSSRWAGASLTRRRQSPSASSPPSRNTKRDSGEITYGGLETMRSKRSPRTAENRSLSRVVTLATPLSPIVNRAKPSARRFRSVATTSPAWELAFSACTPPPVPRSRARPIGRRTVIRARSTELAPTPITWSGATLPPAPSVATVGASLATRNSWPCSLSYGRMRTSPRTRSPSTATRPARSASSRARGASAAPAERPSTGTPTRKSRTSEQSGEPASVRRRRAATSFRARKPRKWSPSTSLTPAVE